MTCHYERSPPGTCPHRRSHQNVSCSRALASLVRTFHDTRYTAYSSRHPAHSILTNIDNHLDFLHSFPALQRNLHHRAYNTTPSTQSSSHSELLPKRHNTDRHFLTYPCCTTIPIIHTPGDHSLMLDTHDTPPPLIHSPSISDRESSKSRDTTPASPVVPGLLPSKPFTPAVEAVDQVGKGQLPWFRRPPRPGATTTSLCVESSPVQSYLDVDEPAFDLFNSPSRDPSMAVNGLTHDNPNQRQTSTSPRGNQPSHLTAALRRSQPGEKAIDTTPTMDGHRPSLAVPESSDMSRFENGARPISVKGRPIQKDRRESLAQSIGMGMSWGGASVGSWIRDE